LWVAATTGQVYRYSAQGTFERIRLPHPITRIEMLLARGDTLWIAGSRLSTGLVREGQLTALRYFDTNGKNITSLAPANEKDYFFVGTEREGLFRGHFVLGQLTLQKVFGSNDPHRVNELPFQSINHIFVDEEGAIWLSTSQQGLGLLRSRFFETVFGLANNNTYAITSGGSAEVLLSFGDVYQIDREQGEYFAEVLPNLDIGFVTGLTRRGNELWMGTANGQLFLYRNRQPGLTIDMSTRGGGVFYLYADRRENIWFCQAPDETPIVGVAKLGPDLQVKYYAEEKGLDDRILVIKESERGLIYAAGIGPETYLYRYREEEDIFINLSLPLPFNYSQNFEVHDMTIDPLGIVWMGTTDGLLRYDLERVSRVELGEYTSTEIRSVLALGDGSIWLATDTHGLIYYHKGSFSLFDEKSGLPTVITAYRCLEKDETGRIWVGTAEGSVHSRDTLPRPEPTVRPILLSFSANRNEREFDGEEPKLPNNSNVEVRYVSLAYPGENIEYQHRLLGSQDSSWSESRTETELFFSRLPYGDYRLDIRARQPGGYAWSAPLQLAFEVRKPWFRTWWGIGLMILAAGGFLYYFFQFNVGILLRRIRFLENALAEQEEAIRQKESQLADKDQAIAQKERDLKEQRDEQKQGSLSKLQMLDMVVESIPMHSDWEKVMEVMVNILPRSRDISGFEFAFHDEDDIHFEGYFREKGERHSRREEFSEKTNLAVWALVHRQNL
ncbi:MAG: hypothetical protein R3350_10520, partial [Saprospiraceae bacterium]|nr:hypothetical protein [Saprospiraceae bacterium]